MINWKRDEDLAVETLALLDDWTPIADLFIGVYDASAHKDVLTLGHMRAWFERRLVPSGRVLARGTGRKREYRVASATLTPTSDQRRVELRKRAVGSAASWCVPTALTAVTGRSYEDCEDMLYTGRGNRREHRNKGGIGGVYDHETHWLLRSWGYTLKDHVVFQQWTNHYTKQPLPTVAQFVATREYQEKFWNHPVLTYTRGHVGVLYQGQYFDNGAFSRRGSRAGRRAKLRKVELWEKTNA